MTCFCLSWQDSAVLLRVYTKEELSVLLEAAPMSHRRLAALQF